MRKSRKENRMIADDQVVRIEKVEHIDGDSEWNDYDLCFPVVDLYENKIRP